MVTCPGAVTAADGRRGPRSHDQVRREHRTGSAAECASVRVHDAPDRGEFCVRATSLIPRAPPALGLERAFVISGVAIERDCTPNGRKMCNFVSISQFATWICVQIRANPADFVSISSQKHADCEVVLMSRHLFCALLVFSYEREHGLAVALKLCSADT